MMIIMKKVILLVAICLLSGCAVTKNFYDKEPLKKNCPKELKTIGKVHFYKGIFVYRDRRDEFPSIGGAGWKKNQWMIMVSNDCREECTPNQGGGQTYAYIDDLIICACAEHNLSNITDKTDFKLEEKQ